MNTSRYLTALAASGVLAFALVGCTDDSAGQSSETPSASHSQDSSSPTDDSGGSGDSSSGDESKPTKGGEMDVALSAVATAESDGGTAIEIDHDDSGVWKIDVVQDGTVSEVKVSEDGGSVESTGDSEQLEGSDKSQFDEAEVAIGDAMKTAFDELPGTLDEAGLTDHDGSTAYEFEIYYDSDNSKKNAYVDAVSGDFMEAVDD